MGWWWAWARSATSCRYSRSGSCSGLPRTRLGPCRAGPRRLLRAGGHRSFQAYYRSIVDDTTGQSLIAMIDALATNHTSFMRERDHFDFLCQQVLQELPAHETIEIWSAACATGEEVWSLAMMLTEVAPSRRFRLWASDISSKALAF